MITKIMILIGTRSACCGAKINVWHAGKNYCSKCEHWISSNNAAGSFTPITKIKPVAHLAHAHHIK